MLAFWFRPAPDVRDPGRKKPLLFHSVRVWEWGDTQLSGKDISWAIAIALTPAAASSPTYDMTSAYRRPALRRMT